LFSGLHGKHFFVGLAGLFAFLSRPRAPASGPRWRMNTRVLANAVALFWHYLDGLWIVLFAPLLFVKR
jgi:heme/copper-type cytochrome/quinol oxidase subunit 3